MKNVFSWSTLFLCSLFTSVAWAVTEIDFDFGYDRQVYGENRQNRMVTRTYSGTMAMYFLQSTALELNYSNSEQTTSEHTEVLLSGTNYTITEMQNRLTTNVYGIGLRQALSGAKARIRPLISAGYARQFQDDVTDYTFRDDTTSASTIIHGKLYKQRQDAVFGSFMLQIYLTQRFALKGSVRTVFPAFEWNKARDDLKYLAGLTWVF
jgi:hypothetical protein